MKKMMNKLAIVLAVSSAMAVGSSVVGASSITANLTPQTNVVASCTALSGTLNFGNYNPVTQVGNLDVTGHIFVTCTQDANVTLSLSAGTAGDFAGRVLTSGSNTIPYNIYTASDHATIFGDGTSSTGTLPVTGSGSTPVDTPIFGRIPSAPGAPAGSYQDTITITATY